MSEAADQIAGYFALMRHNGAAQVYRAAVESGLLDALSTPMSVTALAESAQTDPGATGAVLGVLETLGLVGRQGADWVLTSLAEGLLSGPYRQLGDPYWGHLPAYLRTGEPLTTMDDAATSEAVYARQAGALAWMLGPAAQEAAAELRSRGAGGRVLDVGAGSAVWSLALAALDDDSRVEALDRPAVLGVAERMAAGLGLTARFEKLPGDYHEQALEPGTYDTVLLGNVAHLETPESLGQLLRRLCEATRPGGTLAILDVMPGNADADLQRTLYMLGLALRTVRGQAHAPEALQRLATEAGFGQTEHVVLRATPGVMGMVCATKS